MSEDDTTYARRAADLLRRESNGRATPTYSPSQRTSAIGAIRRALSHRRRQRVVVRIVVGFVLLIAAALVAAVVLAG